MEVTLSGLIAALDDPGRYSTHRERSFGTVATVPDQATLLRPHAFLVDRTTRTVTTIEFTFPDDANLGRKVREKQDKYQLWLTHTPRPDAPILAGIAPPPAHDQRQWHFTHRLRVVAERGGVGGRAAAHGRRPYRARLEPRPNHRFARQG